MIRSAGRDQPLLPRPTVVSIRPNAAVRRVMRGNRGTDTRPEIAVRSSLQRAGLRFRKQYRPLIELRCWADVAFPRARLCLFVDGCFWHNCRKHYKPPRTNATLWASKIQRNSERDRFQRAMLSRAGWTVIRVWEHETTPELLPSVVRRVKKLLLRARQAQPRLEAISKSRKRSGSPKSTDIRHNRIARPSQLSRR
jgi:DNA mismatch endonuclease Vsr